MIRRAILILTFLINLKSKCTNNFTEYIRNRYDVNGHYILRNYQNLHKKLTKAQLDLQFLIKCKTYNVFPKFLRFKLYKRCLHATKFYKSWQNELLINEINTKRKTITSLISKCSEADQDCRRAFSAIDGVLLRRFVNK